MRHIIFFIYILDIMIVAVGITMIFLAAKRQKTEMHVALKRFMICMMIMSLYDFLIYYTDYIIGNMHFSTLLRFGNCIIAVMFYFWLCLAEKMIEGNTYVMFKRLLKNYVIAFVGVWIFCKYVFSSGDYHWLEWIMLASDIVLVLFFLAGSVVYVGEAIWSKKSNRTICYLITVTAVLLWNYASYFLGEASTFWNNIGFVREPLDVTILFWCIANAATLYIIYKMDFSASYSQENQIKEFNLEERLEEVAAQYELTLREKELVALIYEGKSNADIANLLFISESTVKTHIYNIFKKLSVKSRIQLVCVVRGEEI